MARPQKRRFPNIVAVRDPRSGAPRGWRAQVWLAGKLKRGVSRETQEKAHEDAKGFLKLRERIDDDDPEPTLKTAMGRVESMLDVKDRRPATKAWYLEKFEQLKAEFGEDTLLRDVSRPKLQAWINRRLTTDKVSPNTVHHVLRALRRLFSVYNLPSPTRDSRLIVPDQVPSQLTVMSWEQVTRKLQAIREGDFVAWGIFGMVAYSGIRRSELARLAVKDVDLDGEMLRIRHAKVAKQPRTIPMPKGLVEMAGVVVGAGDRFGKDSPWLLPGATEERRVEFLIRLSRKWKAPLHMLRHAFASELARRGVAVNVIARLLGHAIGGTTMRYVHEAMPELRAAMEKLWETPGEKKKRRKGDE